MAISTRKLITAVSAGNFLEWYDYALFAYLIGHLGHIFLPFSDKINNLYQIFLVFGIGFLMRPLGSILFGLVGDHAGRKRALVYSIVLMTIPTFLIGTLPTYSQIGITAVVLLSILRLCQGIPIGGEVGGIMCYLVEVAPKNQKGFFGSFSFLGAQIGFIVSGLEIYCFERWASLETLESWGWRASFILGGCIGVAGWFLRRSLSETPAFEYAHQHHKLVRNPIKNAFLAYKKEMLTSFLLSSLVAGGFYILTVFTIPFFTDIIGIERPLQLLINCGMLTLSVVCLPIFGKLGDRFGGVRVFKFGAIASFFLSYIMFYCAAHQMFYSTLVSYALLMIAMTANNALLPSILAALFPTPVRYTCLAVSYNLSNAILGGLAPLSAVYLISVTGTNVAPAFVLMALSIVTLVPIFIFERRYSGL
jgi:MHS family proline/betaine transporter-like MFS transporter